jgi:hypothetical protein
MLIAPSAREVGAEMSRESDAYEEYTFAGHLEEYGSKRPDKLLPHYGRRRRIAQRECKICGTESGEQSYCSDVCRGLGNYWRNTIEERIYFPCGKVRPL